MFRKILDLQYDILGLLGIFFAFRLNYTKEIYIQTLGYTVNTLTLLIYTIAVLAVHKANRELNKETSEEMKSMK